MTARRAWPLVPAVLFTALTIYVAATRTHPSLLDTRLDATALAHPGWRPFWSALTDTGAPLIADSAAGLLVVALAATRRWRAAVFVAASMVVAAVIRLVVLPLVARARPPHRLTVATGYSYPSGHTTASATLALAAIVLLHGRFRVLLIVVLATWALAIGVSRIALAAHWPTDVAGGWLLAATVVAALFPVVRSP